MKKFIKYGFIVNAFICLISFILTFWNVEYASNMFVSTFSIGIFFYVITLLLYPTEIKEFLKKLDE